MVGSPRVLQRIDAPPVILASASATRARLLAAAGVTLEQRPPAVDEDAVREGLQAEGATPADAVVALAELKAERVARQAPPAAIVLGADQILSCGARWFAKPASLVEARAQLAALAGRRHELATAVVAFRNGARIWHSVTVPRLWLRPCSPEFLDDYLAAVGEQALAAVGAYQIEGPGAQLFARVEGDQFAIQGLPLLEVLEFLRAQGVLTR
ncbi:MAG TPA: Maf family protein [Geminicoccaceae bacterium]|nr:Maf family protein [Geminicoccaceae bacterium]